MNNQDIKSFVDRMEASAEDMHAKASHLMRERMWVYDLFIAAKVPVPSQVTWHEALKELWLEYGSRFAPPVWTLSEVVDALDAGRTPADLVCTSDNQVLPYYRVKPGQTEVSMVPEGIELRQERGAALCVIASYPLSAEGPALRLRFWVECPKAWRVTREPITFQTAASTKQVRDYRTHAPLRGLVRSLPSPVFTMSWSCPDPKSFHECVYISRRGFAALVETEGA